MIRSYTWLSLIVIILAQSTALAYDNSIDDQTPASDPILISRGTHLTFRRYYFISRLDKTMRLLLKIQSTEHISFSRSLRSMKFDLSLFNDKRIIRSLKRIQETKNLKPLFMIWDDFVAYKSLEDDVFIEDFSKEIFIVTRTVLSWIDEHCDNNEPCLEQFTQPSPNKNKTELLLGAIDEITHTLQKIITPSAPHYKKTTLPPPLDLKSEVSTDEIALRFYYIQRLQGAINVFSTMQTSALLHALEYKGVFRSPRIEALLRTMQESGDPYEVMDIWSEIKEYKLIDNIEFIKEFISVIFIALKHLYGSSAAPAAANTTEINIESLEIEDILHAIDIITDQISTNAPMYNGYSASSFKDWLQHYWWIPPLTIGSIAVKIAHYYYVGQAE